MSLPEIALDNDFEPEYDVTRKASATGLAEAATGLTGLTAHIAATDEGATIDASLSVSASERSATAGRYYAVIPGADLRTHLAGYIGRKVWVIFGDDATLDVSDPHLVIAGRRSAS
jgi:hypothetical protein